MERYLASNPQIMSGQPVIKGTRVPISRIIFLLKEGYTLEAIHEEYPHIDIPTLSGAIDEAITTLNQMLHAKKVL
jgi:uncharacterized protein (DUF433 family)